MNIVMCRPDFFDVTYELSTNRWMDLDDKPDKVLALQQWEGLRNNYLKYGISVDIMSGQPKLNDMVFVANAGLPVGRYFVMSRFFHPERMPELPFIYKFFSGRFNVWDIYGRGTFEGQGDALFINDKTLIVGRGIRTSQDGIKSLSRALATVDPEINVIPLQFRSVESHSSEEKVFYHLDTCLLYLKKVDAFILYPDAFSPETAFVLRNLANVVEIEKEEAEDFVCNSVVYGDTIFAPKFDSDRLSSLFDNWDYKVIKHDMSEFMKSGGAVKCLSLELGF